MPSLWKMGDRGQDKMSDQEGFLMDSGVATLFFRVCMRYHITDKKDRLLLLRELARRKKIKYMRDVEPFIAGKKVLKVGFKTPHNNGPEHWCEECRPEQKES
jgi:hypothetical protein